MQPRWSIPRSAFSSIDGGCNLRGWALARAAQGQSTIKSGPIPDVDRPRHVIPDAQPWEGNEFPHTMSVLELDRDGFRYWGWYGLNEGRGIGLTHSNDLLNWTKYDESTLDQCPLAFRSARGQTRNSRDVLHFAVTRNYDTPSSYIVLAASRDGIHLTEEKVLVKSVPDQRNQNPNLFRDPLPRRLSYVLSGQ